LELGWEMKLAEMCIIAGINRTGILNLGSDGRRDCHLQLKFTSHPSFLATSGGYGRFHPFPTAYPTRDPKGNGRKRGWFVDHIYIEVPLQMKRLGNVHFKHFVGDDMGEVGAPSMTLFTLSASWGAGSRNGLELLLRTLLLLSLPLPTDAAIAVAILQLLSLLLTTDCKPLSPIRCC
jgi:hypothetical protein